MKSSKSSGSHKSPKTKKVQAGPAAKPEPSAQPKQGKATQGAREEK